MKNIAVLMIATTLLAGCASQVPLATNHPLTSQKKIRSSHHWDVIADDVAAQTVATLADKKKGLGEKPLFVVSPVDNTSFNTAFRNFLVTRMVNKGIAVNKEKDGAQEIQYELQLVRHNSSRYAHIPGTLTALTAGISVVRDALASGSASAIPALLGVAGLADYGLGHYSGGPTHTELIVTTSIINGGAYAFRKSDIYYIEEADTDLFVEALERPVKQWQIVGK